MTTPVIIDIVAAAVLALFAYFGVRRGLFQALAGLVVVIVALVGAGIIAGALAAPAAKVVTPLIAQHIEQQVEDAMAVQSAGQMPEADTGEDFDIPGLLALMGLDGDVRDSLADQTMEKVRDTGTSVAMAVVESLAQSFLYAALFLVSFLALLLLLRLLVKTLDLVLRLPGLHLLNALGGGAVGLIQGALVLFLAVWVLRRFGVSFENDTVSATYLLRFFTTNTPLSALSFLQ